jgi:hypothetical protein
MSGNIADHIIHTLVSHMGDSEALDLLHYIVLCDREELLAETLEFVRSYHETRR